VPKMTRRAIAHDGRELLFVGDCIEPALLGVLGFIDDSGLDPDKVPDEEGRLVSCAEEAEAAAAAETEAEDAEAALS
jgi:hypothetical protein